MCQDHQGLPRQFYKEQCKEGEEGADQRSVGRIISEWTGLKFCNAIREAENKIKWRERFAMSVACQRSLTMG